MRCWCVEKVRREGVRSAQSVLVSPGEYVME